MKNTFWHQVPIVRLLLPFALGIGISMFYPLPVWLTAIGFFVLLLLVIVFAHMARQYKLRWMFGLLVSFCFVIGGMLLHQLQNDWLKASHFRFTPTATKLFIQLDEQPLTKKSSYKVRCVAVAAVDNAGHLIPVAGKLLLYIGKEDEMQYRYGDVLQIDYDLLKPIPESKNPDEFNYKRYLAFNQIYYQGYATMDKIRATGINRGNTIRKWVYGVQRYFKSVLSRTIASANETAVAQALLYGYDDDIDAETMQAYSNTGTLHVLAVSGMHVGIIFMLISLFLKPLDKNKKLSLVKNGITILILWLYSLLCGLSPSILRATVMFTFIIVSKSLGMRSSVYNTLAASAFVLLCFDSNMLANVGFQLSYLAVLGIVFFQPLIENWYEPQNWLLQQVWSITAVSLAAQLITFPIGLLYFHQFPNCFLFSNLIIIPLTTIILYTGMMLLAFSTFSWLSWLIGQLMFYQIQLTNTIVKWVEEIPYAYVNGIHISIPQSIILYGIIFGFTAYLLFRNIRYLKVTLILTCAFFMIQSYVSMQQKHQSRLVVYSIAKHTALQFFVGRESVLLADSTLLNDAQKFRFHIQQHNWKSGVETLQKHEINSGGISIDIGDFRCVILGSKPPTTQIIADVVILASPIEPAYFDSILQSKHILISPSVPTIKALKLQEQLNNLHSSVTYIYDKQAIEFSINNN